MSLIWPILKPTFEEQSWRVKYAVVGSIGEVLLLLTKKNRSQPRLEKKMSRNSFCPTTPNF